MSNDEREITSIDRNRSDKPKEGEDLHDFLTRIKNQGNAFVGVGNIDASNTERERAIEAAALRRAAEAGVEAFDRHWADPDDRHSFTADESIREGILKLISPDAQLALDRLIADAVLEFAKIEKPSLKVEFSEQAQQLWNSLQADHKRKIADAVALEREAIMLLIQNAEVERTYKGTELVGDIIRAIRARGAK